MEIVVWTGHLLWTYIGMVDARLVNSRLGVLGETSEPYIWGGGGFDAFFKFCVCFG